MFSPGWEADRNGGTAGLCQPVERYDLEQKKITRTIPWPKGEEREGVNIRFSPDGKLLYFFGDDVLILETQNFTEVDTWALSRPIESELGRVNLVGESLDFTPIEGRPRMAMRVRRLMSTTRRPTSCCVRSR